MEGREGERERKKRKRGEKRKPRIELYTLRSSNDAGRQERMEGREEEESWMVKLDQVTSSRNRDRIWRRKRRKKKRKIDYRI